MCEMTAFIDMSEAWKTREQQAGLRTQCRHSLHLTAWRVQTWIMKITISVRIWNCTHGYVHILRGKLDRNKITAWPCSAFKERHATSDTEVEGDDPRIVHISNKNRSEEKVFRCGMDLVPRSWPAPNQSAVSLDRLACHSTLVSCIACREIIVPTTDHMSLPHNERGPK